MAEGDLRGEEPEPRIDGAVLAIGLFDGIGALRVALELIGVPVPGLCVSRETWTCPSCGGVPLPRGVTLP